MNKSNIVKKAFPSLLIILEISLLALLSSRVYYYFSHGEVINALKKLFDAGLYSQDLLGNLLMHSILILMPLADLLLISTIIGIFLQRKWVIKIGSFMASSYIMILIILFAVKGLIFLPSLPFFASFAKPFSMPLMVFITNLRYFLRSKVQALRYSLFLRSVVVSAFPCHRTLKAYNTKYSALRKRLIKLFMFLNFVCLIIIVLVWLAQRTPYFYRCAQY